MQNKNQSFKGFETGWTTLQMNLKMHMHIIVGLLVVQLLVTGIGSYIWYSEKWEELLVFTWQKAKKLDFAAIISEGLPYAAFWARKSLAVFVASFLLWLVYPFILIKLKNRASRQSALEHVRGARLIEPKELVRAIRRDGEKGDIPLGTIRMPVSAEPKHCFIVGRPGVGKTVAISQVIARLRDRDAKGVIYDFKGDYLSKFYDPTKDVIFNPLDTRCQGWNIFNEIETYMDVDSISTSLVPAAQGEQSFWNDAARDVFAGILHYLYQNGAKTNADVWAAVTAPKQDIADWLGKTKGGERGHRYIEDASSKQAMSVFAVMMQYVKSFEYLSKADGLFSLKDWLSSDKGGFIFITSYADIEATLRPILSLFVDLLGRKLLSMPDNYDRRVFFMLDEFGTLQRLNTITKLLTLSRSKGGSCWIGIQDIGQLDKIYTSHLRQAIINACGSNLIFSVADPDTAKFLSEKLGEREYSEVEESHSMGVADYRDGLSLSRRKRIDKIVLPSEIQNLKDLTAFLKFPNYDVTKIQLQYRRYEDKAEPFVCRADLNLANIMAQQAEAARDAEKIIIGGREAEAQRLKDTLKKKAGMGQKIDERQLEV